MGPASTLDWLGRLGQGSNRGFAAKRVVLLYRTRRERVISRSKTNSRRIGVLLMVGTILGGTSAPLIAQVAPAPPPQRPATPTPMPAATQAAATPDTTAAPAVRTIRSIAVRGSQRLEPETIRAYASLAPGQTYTAATLDQALKDLYATQLFADVTISGADTGNLVIT